MKTLQKTLIIFTFCLTNLSAIAGNLSSHENSELSYAIGFKMGQAFKDNNVPINVSYFTKGMTQAISNTSTRMYLSDEEMDNVLKNFQNKTIVEKQKLLNEQAKKNLAQGRSFLKENAKKPGIIVLKNALQYQIMTSGISDIKPTANSTIVVKYIGTHLNGKIFDQSENSTFHVANVISGWRRILPMMKVGDEWKIYIPSSLAYGPGGAPDIIGPNETIIYDITLLKVID